MTQTAEMCKELITQGLENMVQKEFRKQLKTRITTLTHIRDFLSKMCVVEPLPVMIKGEEMFRLTHILTKNKLSQNLLQSYDLSKLRKYKTEVFLDSTGHYNILINNMLVSYKVHTCPPSCLCIAIAMWRSVYRQTKKVFVKEFTKFEKTIEKELLM